MQTNAPAGSEFVDQFNRAVAFGQINVDQAGLPQHASTHATGGSDPVSIASASITDSTTAGRALLTAATVQAQRTALDILVSAANLAAIQAVAGNFQRIYLALDTQKTYVWNGTGYTEISPNTHARAGTNNTNVGETALSSPSLSGGDNTAVGANALILNTTGTGNTAIGYNAVNSNLAGAGNVGVGFNSLFGTAGNFNTGIGAYAGDSITSGQNNTIIGPSADVDSGARSNCVVLGNSAVSPATDGSLAIGGTAGNAMGNLVTTSGGTSASQDLIIYLNGTRYRIALKT
jgi:hypothetical protein